MSNILLIFFAIVVVIALFGVLRNRKRKSDGRLDGESGFGPGDVTGDGDNDDGE